jgi:hypothetical protein
MVSLKKTVGLPERKHSLPDMTVKLSGLAKLYSLSQDENGHR